MAQVLFAQPTGLRSSISPLLLGAWPKFNLRNLPLLEVVTDTQVDFNQLYGLRDCMPTVNSLASPSVQGRNSAQIYVRHVHSQKRRVQCRRGQGQKVFSGVRAANPAPSIVSAKSGEAVNRKWRSSPSRLQAVNPEIQYGFHNLLLGVVGTSH